MVFSTSPISFGIYCTSILALSPSLIGCDEKSKAVQEQLPSTSKIIKGSLDMFFIKKE